MSLTKSININSQKIFLTLKKYFSNTFKKTIDPSTLKTIQSIIDQSID